LDNIIFRKSFQDYAYVLVNFNGGLEMKIVKQLNANPGQVLSEDMFPPNKLHLLNLIVFII